MTENRISQPEQASPLRDERASAPAAFEHRIEWKPGFDKRSDNPATNYGVGAMRIWFYVIGPKGAVQWQISTNWYPESARQHLNRFPYSERDLTRAPEAWDLGYHSRTPRYEGHDKMDHCDLIEGGCYYDGSSLNAEPLVEGFIQGGTDWLWPKLEDYYRHVFDDAPYPDFEARGESSQ